MCVILTTRHPTDPNAEIILTEEGKIPYWRSHVEAYEVAPQGYVALESPTVDGMAEHFDLPVSSFFEVCYGEDASGRSQRLAQKLSICNLCQELDRLRKRSSQGNRKDSEGASRPTPRTVV